MNKRILLLQLLHVNRAFGAISGGLVCVAGGAREGLRESIAVASGEDSPRAPLRTDGVDMSQLEPAKHRLLSLAWSRTDEGMDGVSAGCCGVGTIINNIKKNTNMIKM